jgi:hypothetical protein
MNKDFYIVTGTNPATGNQVDQDFLTFELAFNASKNNFWITMNNVCVMKCVHTKDDYDWVVAPELETAA